MTSIIESKDDSIIETSILSDVSASGYAFASLATPYEYPSFTGVNSQRWTKWGLSSTQLIRLSIVRGGRDLALEGDAFLRDLFASDALKSALPVASKLKEGARIHSRPLKVTATSLSLFDPLIEADALREGTDGKTFIPGRMDEVWDGLSIANTAREALCLPSMGDPFDEDPSDEASSLLQPNRFSDAVSDAVREELLWNLARWVVAGGGMCQYEDLWDPYAEAIKDVARDILSVVRATGDEEGSTPKVISSAWKIIRIEGDSSGGGGKTTNKNAMLFPHENAHNLCLVIGDPLKRLVHILYSPFNPWNP